MVGNHVADLVRRYGADGEIPQALTDYIKAREGYDYAHHGRAGNPDTEFVPDEIVDRFCVLGTVDDHVAKLRELESLGVTQFSVYLMHDAQDETLEAYGELDHPCDQGRSTSMSDLVLAGGTVVTAEGSFRADVAVTGETIEAIGVDLPRDGARSSTSRARGVMPGFIDGHTHMDMPFGGTVTADDWDTGTAAALAGGTTTIVDFSLQDPESTLANAVETWHGKADARRTSTTASTSRSPT